MSFWVDNGSTVAEKCGFMALANEQLHGVQLVRLEFNANVGNISGLYTRQSILRRAIEEVANKVNELGSDLSLDW
ncbi:MAG: hypothetical protein Q4C83_02845 [Candidatus Saccharibacteria bacterium]|nr:hypothetical protein [Candidatus Saccharibacteria bacterium]